jgi:hypothetical protein
VKLYEVILEALGEAPEYSARLAKLTDEPGAKGGG